MGHTYLRKSKLRMPVRRFFMEKYLEIIEVHGREILDSRGNPTVAAIVTVKDKRDRQMHKRYGGSAFRSQHRTVRSRGAQGR